MIGKVPPLIRYLVRRSTGDVWIWSEYLASRPDVEEVYARDPKSALERPPMPNPDKVSIEQIEQMTVQELLIFGCVKLGLPLEEGMPKSELKNSIKEALFLSAKPRMQAASETLPFADARAAIQRTTAGMRVEVLPRVSDAGVNSN